jgi:hypothetical protein
MNSTVDLVREDVPHINVLGNRGDKKIEKEGYLK